MQVEIDIDPGKVNEQVAQAILGSAIGDEIKKQIADKLKDKYTLTKAIGSVLDDVIRKAIHDVISKEPHYSLLKAEAEKAMSEEITNGVVRKAFDDMLERARSRY